MIRMGSFCSTWVYFGVLYTMLNSRENITVFEKIEIGNLENLFKLKVYDQDL